MKYIEEKDIPDLSLLIHFEKAFDSLLWNFVLQILTLFNFGIIIKKFV
jgi:hypothetical protein